MNWMSSPCYRRYDFWGNVPARHRVFARLTANVKVSISPSQAVIEWHVEAGYARDRFRLVRLGSEQSPIPEVTRPGLQRVIADAPGQHVITYAGGGVEIKGARVLLKAIPLLLSQLPQLHVVVAGGGEPALLEEFRYPEYLVSEVLVDRSPGVIVHSCHGLNLLSARCPTARLEYVPMPIPLPPERSPAAARARLNLPADDFLVGVFGVLNDSKQPRAILAAIRQLLDEGVPIKAVFIGRENDTFHLAAEALRLGLSDHIFALGFVDELDVVHDWLSACDVAINLRSPYWGETSVSTLRMLAAGLPIIVNDIGAFSELPDAACLKLPSAEIDLPGALAQTLQQLHTAPERRAVLRLAARQYVAEEHDPRRVAARYMAVTAAILEAS